MPPPSDNFEAYAPFVPDAVKRASARADQLMREAAGRGEGGEPTTVVKNDAENSGTSQEQNTQNQGSQAENVATFETTPGFNNTETRELEPRESREGESRVEKSNTNTGTDEWRQRYLSLKGKYDAEVPTLSGQLRALEGQVSQLQNLLASVRAAPPPNQQSHTQSQPQSQPQAREIPKEDIDAYGEDLVNATQRWTQPIIDQIVAPLRAEIERLKGQTQHTQTQITHSTVEQALDQSIPSWRVTNDDPGFIAWLKNHDPFSGRIKHDMLTEAYGAGDVSRTAAFFRAYENEQTAVTQQPARTTAHTPVQSGAGRVSLDELAAPGRGPTTSSSQGASDKRLWSRSQIAAFFDEKTRGRWVGREADAARMEADIFAAQVENRIR